MTTERHRIHIQGIVQGVGFRPFVYSLARRTGLEGCVHNDSSGVRIEIEGEVASIKQFMEALRQETPPLAVIEHIEDKRLPVHNGTRFSGFDIVASNPESERGALVSPDVSTCDHCLAELFDPADRRFHYPFTNCTHCGPRFTITRDLPYDRPQTTMSIFPLCRDCSREYSNPDDRRFHAQPIACPVCGPQLRFIGSTETTGRDALDEARQRLLAGEVIAVKGLGGYHLACDASNSAAVSRLRQHKHRPHKPFALMAADLAATESVCRINEAERSLLTDHCRPIVLLRKKAMAGVAPEVAPNQRALGVMLPYTPLHHLLFTAEDKNGRPNHPPCRLLVMTSANLSNEPILYRDDDTVAQLSDKTAILTHNRPIHVRCDDSVAQVVAGETVLLRRARGYAPRPISLSFECPQSILAVGAHLKNTFCLGKGRRAFLSQHIGDLENLETLQAFQESVTHFQNLFNVDPLIVAHDLHPDYLSTRYANGLGDVEQVAVQHHHAHVASVMAEHRLDGRVIGVAFDGSGYGPDGTVWGGEFMLAGLTDYSRAAHLRTVPLPGGEQAIREPWRVAAAWLQQLYGDEWLAWPLSFSQEIDHARWRVLRQMIEQTVNTPLTSSAGRLFDAIASLLGVRQAVHYEGQAAMELEAVADDTVQEGYSCSLQGDVLDPAPLIDEVVADLRAGSSVPRIAARFHNGLAHAVAAVCQRLRNEQGQNRVALSGGVFQNRFLLERTVTCLRRAGFDVYFNRYVPPNDGGLSLGQLAVAAKRFA